MSYYHGRQDLVALPQDLQDFAWSAPMRDLAAKVGVSDVGLKKLLKSHGIITPPQGYWNKLHAGKPVPKCPKVASRRPGEAGRVRLDARFAEVVHSVEPLPSSGPFASAAVPGDLDALYEQELEAIGRVAVPRKLERVHHGLTQLFKQEERRREKFAASGWSWDAPKFESAVDKRRLRILNAIFMALGRRGHAAGAHERDGEIHASATIGDTRVGLSIGIAVKHRTVREFGRDRPAPDLPASTPLTLVINANLDGKAVARWEDNKGKDLESMIAPIVASIVVAGEANFRRGLRQAEEWAEQSRQWEEQRRREQVEARNRERLGRLRESAELLRQAEELRALVARVRDAVVAGSVGIHQASLAAWEEWASAEADRLDPVLSGQVLTHLEET
ncbi:hypothetical protein ACMC5O_002356 [Sphingomonas sediminicola]|uniref:hypothetical protein n=1 Tax=Sphingomonas sediminicola TaxID=386874 RepID=UPI003CE86A49